jgi:hypothetical protein
VLEALALSAYDVAPAAPPVLDVHSGMLDQWESLLRDLVADVWEGSRFLLRMPHARHAGCQWLASFQARFLVVGDWIENSCFAQQN